MNTYKYIINPATGRRVLSNGKIGQQIIRNYINEYQQGGASLMRRARATGASISRGARSAAKSTGAAATKAKEAARLKKDKAAWTGMSTNRKCELCEQVTKKDANTGKSQCDAYYEAKKQEADAKAATQKAKLDTLTQQMNTHKSMAEDLRGKMQLELAQNQMLEARLVAKEIALVTGKPYEDPFGLGQHPSGDKVKANPQTAGGKRRKSRAKNPCGFNAKSMRCSRKAYPAKKSWCYLKRKSPKRKKRFCAVRSNAPATRPKRSPSAKQLAALAKGRAALAKKRRN